MRQLSPQTNIILALLAAIGVPVTLGLPWYARASVAATDDGSGGSVEAAFAAIARWFTSDGTTYTGSEALTRAETALLAVCAVAAVLVLMLLVPSLRFVRSPARLVGFAAPAIVAVHLFLRPAGEELRWGTFAALAASLLLANSVYHAAEIRDRRPKPLPYRPPAPPPGSFAPPGA